MIKFSNGHELTFACASGALAFDGRGWPWEQPLRWLGILDPKAFTVVAKTVTIKPIKGNLSLWHPWSCVRILHDEFGRCAATNAIGLTNPGIEVWIEKHYPKAKKMGYKIAPSVKPENPAEAQYMASALYGLDLAYIEVNISCPNVYHVPENIPQILSELCKSGHPIVLKLSKSQVQKGLIEVVDPYVEAYHAINTIPWDDIFPSQTSPIEHYSHKQKGGVSGKFIHIHALRCVQDIIGWSSKPVIGGGGIFDIYNVRNFKNCGASAFSIGTCFLLRPWKPNQIVREFNQNSQ